MYVHLKLLDIGLVALPNLIEETGYSWFLSADNLGEDFRTHNDLLWGGLVLQVLIQGLIQLLEEELVFLGENKGIHSRRIIIIMMLLSVIYYILLILRFELMIAPLLSRVLTRRESPSHIVLWVVPTQDSSTRTFLLKLRLLFLRGVTPSRL